MNNIVIVEAVLKKSIYCTNKYSVIKIKNHEEIQKLMAYRIEYGKSLVNLILDIDDVNLYKSISHYINTKDWVNSFANAISDRPSNHTYITFFMMLMKSYMDIDLGQVALNCAKHDNIDLFMMLERKFTEKMKHLYQKCVDVCGRYNSIELLRYLTTKKGMVYNDCLRNLCEKGNKEAFDVICRHDINVLVNNYELYDYVIKSLNVELLNKMLSLLNIKNINDEIMNRWIIKCNIYMLNVILNYVGNMKFSLNDEVYKRFVKNVNPSEEQLEYIRLVLNIDSNIMNVIVILKAGYCIKTIKNKIVNIYYKC